MKQFKLNINLGNDAMESPRDIADALRSVAKKIEEYHAIEGIFWEPILDYNGNVVGEYLTKQKSLT